MRKLSAIVIVTSLFVTGCAYLVTQKDLVIQDNWYQIGFNDGKWGERSLNNTRLTDIAKRVDPEMKPDIDAYQQGYQQGVETYCTLDRLQKIGMEGKFNWGVCEFRREDQKLYMMEWQRGIEKYTSFQ